MIRPNELYHFGIEGMKWGIRRYQNPDGSLTDAGRKRLGRAKQEYSKLEPSRKKYLANKPTIDTASALALDRYKSKKGELVANTLTTGAVAGGAAFVGGKLFGPYGAAIAGGLPVLKNLPKGIQLAIETAYNKIQYEDADKLRKAYEKSEKHKSVIDELEGNDSDSKPAVSKSDMSDSKPTVSKSDMFRNGRTNEEIIETAKKNTQTLRKYHDDELEEYAKNAGYNTYREYEDAKYDKMKSMMNSPMMGNANKMFEKKFGINMSDMMDATQEASKEYDKNKKI